MTASFLWAEALWRLAVTYTEETLLSILADLNNAVVCIVSILSLISNSSIKFMIWPDILYTLRQSIVQFYGITSYNFLYSIHGVLIIYSSRVFHISDSWWFYTGVWMKASLLKSPGLVSGFWPFLTMLSFG